ncbi:hypothetical protein FJTKL_05769 [Diaporthe vaccinii]|uniref:Uncharacterized protein n=1 Tax=Diaporthe vaccinii TaxID=105482 RepID=A0ABR4EXT9_9PEZI
MLANLEYVTATFGVEWQLRQRFPKPLSPIFGIQTPVKVNRWYAHMSSRETGKGGAGAEATPLFCPLSFTSHSTHSPRHGQHVARDAAHPLAGQLEPDPQKLLRNVRLALLQLVPVLAVHQPHNAVPLRRHLGRAVRLREEGQLAARRARHDALVQPPLREVVLGLEDPALHQVEPLRRLARTEQHVAPVELLADEKVLGPHPKVLVAVREVVEDLQHQPQRLLEVLPPRQPYHLALRQRLLRRLVQVAAPRRAPEQVVAQVVVVRVEDLSHRHVQSRHRRVPRRLERLLARVECPEELVLAVL